MLTRNLVAGGLAFGVTVALLLVMSGLIRPTGEVIEQPPISPPLNFVRVVEELIVEPEKAPEPPVEVPPEPVTKLTPTIDLRGGGFTPAVFVAPPVDDAPAGPAQANGDYIPMLTVAPDYPSRAAQRGIEGYVIVEYTVDELGRPQAVHVLYGEPAKVFDRAAVNAVKRYKYKPRVVDGKRVPVHGVRQRISFELS